MTSFLDNDYDLIFIQTLFCVWFMFIFHFPRASIRFMLLSNNRFRSNWVLVAVAIGTDCVSASGDVVVDTDVLVVFVGVVVDTTGVILDGVAVGTSIVEFNVVVFNDSVNVSGVRVSDTSVVPVDVVVDTL